MKKYLKLYPRYLLMAMKSKLIYRLDSFLGMIGLVCSNVAAFTTLYLAMNGMDGLGGWSFNHIIFLYGFLLLPMGFDHMLTDRLWNYGGWLINNGEMDRILMKPLNPLFQMCAEFFQEGGAGELILGTIFMIVSGLQLNIDMSFGHVFPIVIGALFSTLIYFSVKVFTMSLAFYKKRSVSIMSAFYNIKDFGKYPASIYHGNGVNTILGNVVYNFLLFILPFGLVGYLPLAAQLFPDQNIKFLWFEIPPNNWLIMGIIIAVSLLHFVIAYSFFKHSLKHYNSSGS